MTKVPEHMTSEWAARVRADAIRGRLGQNSIDLPNSRFEPKPSQTVDITKGDFRWNLVVRLDALLHHEILRRWVDDRRVVPTAS